MTRYAIFFLLIAKLVVGYMKQTFEYFNNTKNDVNIVCSTDRGQFIGLIALINSVIKNTKTKDRIKFHILVDIGERKILLRMLNVYFMNKIRYEIKEFNPPQELISNIRILHGNVGIKKPMNFSRFYFHKTFTNIDKIIYLDCDMIVQDDAVVLYDSIKLDKYFLAAVSICKAKDMNDFKPELYKQGINPNSNYFNAGLFCTSLKRWNEHKVTSKLEHIMMLHKNSKDGLYEFGTQSAMNIVFNEYFEEIDRNWNVTLKSYMTKEYIDKNIKCIHWTGSKKPWKRCGKKQCGLSNSIWMKYNLMNIP